MIYPAAKRLRSLLLLAALLAVGDAAIAADGASWRAAAPMPEARTEVSAATDGKAIYVLGGFAAGRGGPVAAMAVFKYDIASDTWAKAGEVPQGFNHAGAAIVGGRLFVIGGFRQSSSEAIADVKILDLATGRWSRGAPLPTARGALAVAVLDGKIHAIGGAVQGGTSVGLHDVYDPETDKWRRLAPLHVPRNHLAAAVVGGKIYAFGGREAASDRLTANEAYDPASDSWRPVQPLPTGRSGLATVAYGDKVIAFGGESEDSVSRIYGEVEAYGPDCNCWQKLPPMLTPRHGLGAVVVGSRIFLVSGGPGPGFTYSAANEVLSLPAP